VAMLNKLLTFALLTLTPFIALEATFGYVSYSSFNIGDDIQSVAAKRFLPANSVGINREYIGAADSDEIVHTIVNGWFMHTKNFAWYLKTPAPAKSWPPAPCINPLLVSIHLTEGFIKEAFSEEAVEYLKENGPVGARDLPTLKELQARDIPSYFSGCLTLTLENKSKTRIPVIYAVDIDKECVDYIKAHTTLPVVSIEHCNFNFQWTSERRLKHAEWLLTRYEKAHCVITTRFHASMPCLALETPVLLINSQGDRRFDGIRELVHHCSKDELISGAMNYNFNTPPENPKDYLPLREHLIERVTDFVNTYKNL